MEENIKLGGGGEGVCFIGRWFIMNENWGSFLLNAISSRFTSQRDRRGRGPATPRCFKPRSRRRRRRRRFPFLACRLCTFFRPLACRLRGVSVEAINQTVFPVQGGPSLPAVGDLLAVARAEIVRRGGGALGGGQGDAAGVLVEGGQGLERGAFLGGGGSLRGAVGGWLGEFGEVGEGVGGWGGGFVGGLVGVGLLGVAADAKARDADPGGS